MTVTRLLAAPSGLQVTAGDGSLDLAWTAPPGTVTGYDVHYTSALKTGASAVADDAAVQTGGVSAGWTAVSRGTETDPPTASQTVSSLTNNTEYRVRVRAKNSDGNGDWVHGAGTPQQTDTTGPSAPVFDPGAGDTVTDAGRNITLTFTEAVKKDNANADFTSHSDLSAILTLTRTNASGTAIPYAREYQHGRRRSSPSTRPATSPTGTVYVGISSAYYDENGNAGTAASATFTVAAPSTPVQSSDANLSALGGEHVHELPGYVHGAEHRILLGFDDKLQGDGGAREDAREARRDGGRHRQGHRDRAGHGGDERLGERAHRATRRRQRPHGAGHGRRRDDEGLHGHRHAGGAGAGNPHGDALGLSEPRTGRDNP